MVLAVFLGLPWSSRRTAANSLSAIFSHDPSWTDTIISGLESTVERSELNPKAVLEALQCLATPTHPRREDLALGVLLLTHHSQISERAIFFSLFVVVVVDIVVVV